MWMRDESHKVGLAIPIAWSKNAKNVTVKICRSLCPLGLQLHRHTPFGPFYVWDEPLLFLARMYLGDLHEEHVVPKPRKRGSRCTIALSILLTFIIICICHQLLEPVSQASIHASRSLQPDLRARHPDKTVAVVQYDNPDRISLLDCYLKVPLF